MKTVLFCLLSLLPFTIATTQFPETVTRGTSDNLLEEYLKFRKDTFIRCAETDLKFRTAMNGANLTVIMGPSGLTLAETRPENKDKTLIFAQAGNVLKGYYLRPTTTGCQFFEHPVSVWTEKARKVFAIGKFYLKNVYSDFFNSAGNMTEVWGAKGNTDMYYGYYDDDATYLRERQKSLDAENYLEKRPNDSNAKAIRAATGTWQWPMPAAKDSLIT
jgi:hypothetical protein